MKKLTLITFFVLTSVFTADTAFAAATITNYPSLEACQASCTTTGAQGCQPTQSLTATGVVTTWQCNAPSLMDTVDRGSCEQSTPGADYICTLEAGTAPIGCTEINNGNYRCPGANDIPEGYIRNIPVPQGATTQPIVLNEVTVFGTACTPGHLCYTPLEPIPGLTLGGAELNFPDFLKAIFRLLFSLAALLAVGRLVIGGIMYMTSVSAGAKSQARTWATSSLYGLLILAGSYLILFTINPELIKLKLFVSSTPSVSSGGGVLQNTNSGGSNSTGSTGGSSGSSNSNVNSLTNSPTPAFAGMDCDNRGQIESSQDGCIVTCFGGNSMSCGANLSLTPQQTDGGADTMWFLSSDLTTSKVSKKAAQAFSSDCTSYTDSILLIRQTTGTGGVPLTAYVCANR
jgi:hypothetical protein